MSPDLAFGCSHRHAILESRFDGIRWRTFYVCRDCRGDLAEYVRDEKVRA